jgi:peptide/nickel transport system substrate-binding protein
VIQLTNQVTNIRDKSSGLTFVSNPPDDFVGFDICDTTGAISKPMGSELVREAMNYALNRTVIDRAVYSKYAVVSSSIPYAPWFDGYTKALADYYTYNPTKAKQLLAEAGYPHGFAVNALVDPGDELIAEAIAGYEAKIGITLNISVHSTDFITQMFTGNWPMVLGNYPLNAAQYLTVATAAGPTLLWNPRHNTYPSLNPLLNKIQVAPSPAAARPLYTELGLAMAKMALFINPAILETTFGYNASKIKVTPTVGQNWVPIYDVKPAS